MYIGVITCQQQKSPKDQDRITTGWYCCLGCQKVMRAEFSVVIYYRGDNEEIDLDEDAYNGITSEGHKIAV